MHSVGSCGSRGTRRCDCGENALTRNSLLVFKALVLMLATSVGDTCSRIICSQLPLDHFIENVAPKPLLMYCSSIQMLQPSVARSQSLNRTADVEVPIRYRRPLVFVPPSCIAQTLSHTTPGWVFAYEVVEAHHPRNLKPDIDVNIDKRRAQEKEVEFKQSREANVDVIIEEAIEMFSMNYNIEHKYHTVRRLFLSHGGRSRRCPSSVRMSLSSPSAACLPMRIRRKDLRWRCTQCS